jgi:hypothetical protein
MMCEMKNQTQCSASVELESIVQDQVSAVRISQVHNKISLSLRAQSEQASVL